MIRNIATFGATFLLLFVFVDSALAKAPTARITITGPGIAQPVELTHEDAISAHVWGGNFIDKQSGIVAAPGSELPQYTVQFHVRISESDVRMMYVVYYVWDAASGRALIQVPGVSDQSYRLNVSTISRCCQGKWFYASAQWGETIKAALPSKW